MTAVETKWETVMPTLATRVDMGNLRVDMGNLRADMADFRADMIGIRADMFGLRAEVITSMTTSTANVIIELRHVDASIHKMDASLKTWMLGTFIAMFVAFGGLSVTLSNSSGMASRIQSAPAVSPVTIDNLPAQASASPTVK